MNQHELCRLRAYLDGELSRDAMQSVATHIDRCARCAEEVNLLRSRAEAARSGLGALETSAPDPERALSQFHSDRVEKLGRGLSPANLSRSIGEMKRNALSPRWRPAMVALSALLVVAILFTIAPVREAAADFLGLFRIRKFAVIPLDSGQMERLEQLARNAEKAFSEPQILREEGPEQPVSDAAEASALAAYAVRTPTRLPEGATLNKFAVRSGPALRVDLDRATLAAVLQAAGAPLDALPNTDKITFDVDVPNSVLQEYTARGGRLEFMQVPSPAVNMPEGIDPIALAEAGFLFLGMPQEDARRLATTIDWTSTLVIPLPANAVSAREVTVDGVAGLLLEEVDRGRRNSALAWEKGGVLYFMNARNLDERALLDAADSLQ